MLNEIIDAFIMGGFVASFIAGIVTILFLVFSMFVVFLTGLGVVAKHFLG